jgi:hypothetical protein
MDGLVLAAREVKEKGSFGYLERILPGAELAGYLKK